MKKFIKSIILVFSVLAVSLGVNVGSTDNLLHISQVEAASYFEPQGYLNGDYNYPLMYDHMGVYFYLDKSSVVMQSKGGLHNINYGYMTVSDSRNEYKLGRLVIENNNVSGYHIYRDGANEITGYGYEQPDYNIGLYLIGYLGI